MEGENQNIVLFPKLKSLLKEQAADAYREQKYEKSLEIYQHLQGFGEVDHEIIFGQLLCLVELREFNLAQSLCEKQLFDGNENYYDYLHLYVTILFQTEQYDFLKTILKKELNKITLPPHLEDYFRQLYDLTLEISEEDVSHKEKVLYDELDIALKEEDVIKQNNLLNKLSNLEVKPNATIFSLLAKEHIHPVIKTNIVQWLQKQNIDRSIVIEKFGRKTIVNPIEIDPIKKHKSYEYAMNHCEKMKNNDPTFGQMLEKMTFRHFYVLYPFLPGQREINKLIKTMKLMIRENLYGNLMDEKDLETKSLIKIVQKYESIYLSILGS